MFRTFTRLRIGEAALMAVTVMAPLTAAGVPASEDCYDRKTQPYTFVVDGHLHFRPFGGEALPFQEVTDYLTKSGVRYANVFGIGQKLPVDTECTYYLDCPGTPVSPSIRNDFVNAENIWEHKPKGIHLTLAMTFPDLANPETIVSGIKLLDKEYPGMFEWMGEVNLVKQALFPNHHEAATSEDIKNWAPFMQILQEREIPITIHSDLGSDKHPTEYQHLMEEVLQRYPKNKIVWAHMGLSKELPNMKPEQHIGIMKQFLNAYQNLTLDVSWRVLEDLYFSKPGVRSQYTSFFNSYSTRAIPGTDFVASRSKDYKVYEEELEVNSRINKDLSDEAFRNIALGENYFRLLGLKEQAPQVCKA
ncbi:MAG: amidohydrolase family protein [Pseudonocardiaceae bacterium]